MSVAPGIRACWAEAGHMLGSASIQLLVEDDGRTKRVVFSGDLGPKGAPILRDFEPFQHADMVFIESTYGDHDHRSFRETVDEYVSVVKDAVRHGGMAGRNQRHAPRPAGACRAGESASWRKRRWRRYAALCAITSPSGGS